MRFPFNYTSIFIHSQCQTLVFVLLSMLLCVSSCNHKETNYSPKYSDSLSSSEIKTYTLGVYPLHNPTMLYSEYLPLMDYLNSHIKKVRFCFEASRDYKSFESKIRNKKLDFVILNPYQTAIALKVGYHVLAMDGNKDDCRGLFVVRKDNKIAKVEDFKCKKISYASKSAFAGCIIPQFHLFRFGIDVNKEVTNLYVGSHESSLMSVYSRSSDIAVTCPHPWRKFKNSHAQEASQLKVILQTEALMPNPIMSCDGVPANIEAEVRDCLFNLDKTTDGRKVLTAISSSGFVGAKDDDYIIIQQYIEKFEKYVRKIQE